MYAPCIGTYPYNSHQYRCSTPYRDRKSGPKWPYLDKLGAGKTYDHIL